MRAIIRRGIPRFGLVGAMVLTMSACETPRIAGAPTDNGMAAARQARATELLAQPNRYARGVEDEFLRLEAELPGFGGFYLNRNGEIVAVSAGATVDGAVQGRVAEYLLAAGARFAKPDGSLPSVRVERGQYAFSDLLDFLFRVRAQLTADDAIVLLDADEQRNRLRLAIGPKGSPARALELARRAGVDTAALYVELAQDYPRAHLNSLRDRWRATFAGIKTVNAGGDCTMGFHVTDSVGTNYFLTASHCTGNYSGAGTTVFYQPTSSSSNIVGVESINPAWNTSGCMPLVTYCRLADVALVQFSSSSLVSKLVGQSSTVGTGNNAGNITLGSLYNVAAGGDAISGTTVIHTGQYGGSTSGTIVGTCADVGPISAQGGAFYTEVFCGTDVQASSDGGDSGGPVYHFRFPLSSSYRQADGVLFAGGNLSGTDHYFYSSWTEVQSNLGRTLTSY